MTLRAGRPSASTTSPRCPKYEILLPAPRYTPNDYSDLRAYCLKLPIERTSNLYADDESREV